MTLKIHVPLYVRLGEIECEVGTLIIDGEDQGVEISREKVTLFQSVVEGSFDATP